MTMYQILMFLILSALVTLFFTKLAGINHGDFRCEGCSKTRRSGKGDKVYPLPERRGVSGDDIGFGASVGASQGSAGQSYRHESSMPGQSHHRVRFIG